MTDWSHFQNYLKKYRVPRFTRSFRSFQENKRQPFSPETKPARLQFHFAPKIIKIHLVGLKNELIEVCMLVKKKCQKWSRLHARKFWYCSPKVLYQSVNTHTHMKAWHTRDSFWHFFWTCTQTSISSFSKTNKWILMIFGAKWSWGLACFVSGENSCRLLSWKGRKLRVKRGTLFFPTVFF